MATATEPRFRHLAASRFRVADGLRLQQGQKIYAEPSAMASMSKTVQLVSGFKGGMLGSLGLRLRRGESMITNTFTCDRRPRRRVLFAAGAMGDTVHHRMSGAASS